MLLEKLNHALLVNLLCKSSMNSIGVKIHTARSFKEWRGTSVSLWWVDIAFY